MHKRFDHQALEKKWQAKWRAENLYQTTDNSSKPKTYVLDMFPYPSGEGLHVGHPKGYIATDIYSRFKRMTGHEVLHPMGWDAFGLPAENFAIKHKVHPRAAVEKNVARFKEQLEVLGFDYDWSREINTTDPEYYKWTQWIFLQLFKKGLAYESNEPINWCPGCQTGLANEDLEADGTCERCGSAVEQKPMRQWVLKIRAYADRMLEDLKTLEWPEHIKEAQRNWIGRSAGALIDFPLTNLDKAKKVLILHGRKGTPESLAFPWLRCELEKRGYEVQIPALPNSGEPDDEAQADFVEKNCILDDETVIIAHSFGGVVALRLLERGHKVNRVVLAATPFSGVFNDGQVRASVTAACQKGFDFTKIRQNAVSFVVLRDTTDEIVPASDAEQWAQNLNAKFMAGAGNSPHFSGQQEPDLLYVSVPTCRVFTTRPDTLFGVTHLVLAPESTAEIILSPKSIKNWNEVESYIKLAGNKKEMDRLDATKEKTGVRLEGVNAVNPANGEVVAVYVADYVLSGYGTGAIMAVPAHDERDHQFAQRYGIEFKQVVAKVFDERSSRDKERTGVYALMENEKGEYLVQFYRGHDYYWLPGGGLEEKETVEECLHRELKEESGFSEFVEVRRLGELFFDYTPRNNKEASARNHSILFHVIVDSKDQGEISFTDDEIKYQLSPAWMKPDQLINTVDNSSDSYRAEFIKTVISLAEGKVITDEGILVHSGEFSGMSSKAAKAAIVKKVGGRTTSTYKIKDWVFSRQRYWGEPIPIIHCEKCGAVPVPEEQLPVELPPVEHYEPAGDGQSPLATIDSWVNTTCPKCGGAGARETNTMPQWAGSSWYYLRYMDPKNDKALVSKENEKFWAPVDVYVGGDHAVRHLIYARFWHKFLYDIGVVSTLEPFQRLEFLGFILAPDGRKMSKRWGNVINPDDIVALVGADTLRVYEMFMGPFENVIAWSQDGLAGARRFLERVYGLADHISSDEPKETVTLLHKTLKKVSEDIEGFKFNTAVSTMMIFLNQAEKSGLSQSSYEAFLRSLAPFAPHLTEELWADTGQTGSIHKAAWPDYEPALAKDTLVTIGVQINGKMRGEVTIAPDTNEADALKAVLENESLAGKITPTEIKKVIYVPGRIVNIIKQ